MVDDDELEDEPEPAPPIDPTRAVKRLALAIVVQAVLDYKSKSRESTDAARFLYPSSNRFREHLCKLAQCAGLNLAWLNECLARTVDSPIPTLRHCLKCKSPFPPEGFATHSSGGRSRYCLACRELTPEYPKQSLAARHRAARERLQDALGAIPG
jgi:hypothetical protein